MRTRIFASVEHIRESGALTEEQVAERRQLVVSDRTLVTLRAKEVSANKLLRKLQMKYILKARGDAARASSVLVDFSGRKHTRVKEYSRKGNSVEAHYREWGTKKGDKSTPPVSLAHEEAVECAAQLAMDNKLVVLTVCTHEGHETGWFNHSVPAEMLRGCVDRRRIRGSGAGIRTVISYRWVPNLQDPNEFFVLDAAVLLNGNLHTAIEVQKSHANSAAKRLAFAQHQIRTVQIEASEINEKCSGRNWETDGFVHVHNHPVDALEAWICPSCEPKVAEEKERRAALAEAEALEQAKRDAYEKDKLVSFDDIPGNLEAGKFLKGFVRVEPRPSVDVASVQSDLQYARWELATAESFTGHWDKKDIRKIENKITSAEKRLEKIINGTAYAKALSLIHI